MTLKEFAVLKNSEVYRKINNEQRSIIDLIYEYWRSITDPAIFNILLFGYSSFQRADKKAYNALKARVSYYKQKFEKEEKGANLVKEILEATDSKKLRHLRNVFFGRDLLMEYFDFDLSAYVEDSEENEYVDRARLIEVLKILGAYTKHYKVKKLKAIKNSEIEHMKHILSNTGHPDYGLVITVLRGQDNE